MRRPTATSARTRSHLRYGAEAAGQRPCNGVWRAAARAADLALARSVIVQALVSLDSVGEAAARARTSSSTRSPSATSLRCAPLLPITHTWALALSMRAPAHHHGAATTA